jgi:hypothetical protein
LDEIEKGGFMKIHGKLFVGSVLLGCILAISCQKKTLDLTATAKKHIDAMARGDFARVYKNFDQTMRSALPQDKLQITWSVLIGQVGAYKQQIGTRTETVDQYDVVYVTCEFERANINIKVVFNKAGQIAGLFFLPA